MTRKELSQVFYLGKELKLWHEELQTLQCRMEQCGKWPTGMPRSGGVSDPTGELAAELANCKLMLGCKEVEIQIQRNRIIRFINEIDSSYMRQIIYLRCISCLPWQAVANHIGGECTEQSVKKAFYRYLKERE